MHLERDSAAGRRFLAAVKEGRGPNRSARAAGVFKETGYRWLRESFLVLRGQGLSVEEAQVELGYFSPLIARWDQQYPSGARRHHLRVQARVEDDFWECFMSGDSLEAARRNVGVGRSTAYRWWRARYERLREEGISVRAAARELRVAPEHAKGWEMQRREAHERARRERESAQRRAVRDSARHAEELLRARAPRSDRQVRESRYWELVGSGMTNTGACKILGMHRKTGTRLRARHYQQKAPSSSSKAPAGRYLCLRERLQIADLLRLDCSLRTIAADLGRSPSTIKREVDRHRDAQGRYLPHGADHAAAQQRCRPKAHKLIANPTLRALVQRKLNRCWSPDEISGWLRRTYPEDTTMRLCPETMYRALLVPGGKGLDKRYCRKLRTGRQVRKSRWLHRPGQGGAVQNMTMIDQRPAEVETKEEAGHWEGDLVRHEALCDRAEVKDLRRCAVAAA